MPQPKKRSLTTWLLTAFLLCSLIAVSFAMSKAVVFFRFFSQFNGAVVDQAGLPAPDPDPAIADPDPTLADPSGVSETQPGTVTRGTNDPPPAAGSNPPAANISPDPANPPETATPDPAITDPVITDPDAPVPVIPAVPENLAAAAREVSNADKAAAARIIMTKLSSSDLNRLMALADGELTEEKKGEAIGILQNKLTPDEYELLMALAGKYKELIKRALGK